jgi:hypothetical protein
MQINTDTTSSGRENEDLLFRFWILEVVDSQVTFSSGCLTVNTAVLVASDAQKVVKNIEQSSHLTENKYFTTFTDKFWDQMIKHLELHGCINDMISVDERWSRLNLVK